jgi:hypothetical protein
LKIFRAALAVLFYALLTIGCGPAGRVHVSEKELLGTYTTDFSGAYNRQTVGKEQIIFRSDKTYEQIFSSPTKQFTNRGNWKLKKLFLSGTEIELDGFNVSDNEPSHLSTNDGILFLQVHRENGKIKLARNEAFDWYYDRVH